MIMLSLALFNSCASEQPSVTSGQGYLQPTVQIDPTIILKTDNSSLRLEESVIPTPEMLSLTMSTADGSKSHTWDSYLDFDSRQSYLAGSYDFRLFTSPKFTAQGYADITANSQVVLEGGQVLPFDLMGRVADAMARVSANGNLSSGEYTIDGITVHTTGGVYRDIPLDDISHRYDILLPPGELTIITSLHDTDNHSASIVTHPGVKMDAGYATSVGVGMKENSLSIDINDQSLNRPITPAYFLTQGPVITTHGFNPGETITSVEGLPLKSDIAFKIESALQLKSLILSINTPVYYDQFNNDVDLMGNSPLLNELKSYGLAIDISPDLGTATIDITKLIENAGTIVKANTEISLLAIDELGRCSEPVKLTVITSAVDFQLESLTTAVIGINKAEATLRTSTAHIETNDIVIKASNVIGEQVTCPITDWHADPTGERLTISFDVPSGTKDVPITIEYMGSKRIEAQVHRANPPLTLTTDDYATNAIIYLDSEQPEVLDEATALVTFLVNGQRATIREYNTKEHYVVLSALTPATTYRVEAKYGDLTPATSTTITTEAAEDVPGGDFEDIKESIKYESLPSGGRYSTTNLQIVNRQNYTDILVNWPKKYWASVNAKTFCKSATNHNTWYMMPSSTVLSEGKNGTKAIQLTSVGWDLDGRAIPDYIQQPGQSLNYNANVPHVTHRSAGKLFLGSYHFNPQDLTETYTEGVKFTSRPSSLNGFYKYTPDASHNADRGLVIVELMGNDQSSGQEVTIANGRGTLTFAPDYTVFSVPINYTRTGIKATRLKIMFSSSVTAGDIDTEDSRVPVTADPAHGVMSGSVLTIDNLSFSY